MSVEVPEGLLEYFPAILPMDAGVGAGRGVEDVPGAVSADTAGIAGIAGSAGMPMPAWNRRSDRGLAASEMAKKTPGVIPAAWDRHQFSSVRDTWPGRIFVCGRAARQLNGGKDTQWRERQDLRR